MSCTQHHNQYRVDLDLIRYALQKAAAKKKFANFLDAKRQFELYLEVLRCDICGLGEFYCDHSACCEDTYFEWDYAYCPDCGTRIS